MWNDISIRDFIELKGVEKTPFESNIEKEIECISILADIDIDEINSLDIKEYQSLVKSLAWSKLEPSTTITPSLKLYFNNQVTEFKYKPNIYLTLGEFIDLNNYIQNDDFLSIVCLVYRQYKIDEFNNVVFEPLAFDIEERKKSFIDIPITSVYGAYAELIKYRDSFYQTYEQSFVQTPELEDDEELDPEDIEAEKEEEKLNVFSWERLIYDLVNGDLTKVDRLTDLPLILVFNMLSMKRAFSI